VSEIIKHY